MVSLRVLERPSRLHFRLEAVAETYERASKHVSSIADPILSSMRFSLATRHLLDRLLHRMALWPAGICTDHRCRLSVDRFPAAR